jgi:ABC-type multidrug transport system fused ATPase/permease subunit
LVAFDHFSASWTEKSTLTNINFRATGNDLVAIVGPVGSGKTSLLMGVLGELLPSHGALAVDGEISYASQEAWILSDTIRNNITFGRRYEPAWYQAVVKACQFVPDLALFEAGDETEVGERGVTLSGGQKARLNLCRAVYRNGDVFLLDDPLSALDAKVGRRLFEDCICGLLKNKLRLLVTHQLQFIKDADLVVVLRKDGTISSVGRWGVPAWQCQRGRLPETQK